MFFCHFLGIVVFMAVDTTEEFVIPCLQMTIGAIIPLPFVFTRINREIGVMDGKTGWFPIGSEGVTQLTILWKAAVIYALSSVENWFAWWSGDFAVKYSARWQSKQVTPVGAKFTRDTSLWQTAQSWLACTPINGKEVLSCINVRSSTIHDLEVWHRAQSLPTVCWW